MTKDDVTLMQALRMFVETHSKAKRTYCKHYSFAEGKPVVDVECDAWCAVVDQHAVAGHDVDVGASPPVHCPAARSALNVGTH